MGGAEYDDEQDNDYYVLYNYATDERMRVINNLIVSKRIYDPIKTDKYVYLLLTYDKHNRLNIYIYSLERC